ncbi:hypothetical protein GP2_004_00650 [Gordonia paraffinivorans NBRC 108238]|uniref:DUF1214 domain-containing protein n=1 Tax=Gordonia paraffinivorans NBRC 108238 TaxID=1223543 RepID=A0ABQ0IGN9_9ACTN|nr:hypothetical protein [Gordonia paraffinivorans]MCD2145634.1 hypothetical protein [Gordonia paraffinivorans]GAC82747.1 hypothetical protein GP2_004_00650 [Gordonia paraffinivorans NBRC 108238]
MSPRESAVPHDITAPLTDAIAEAEKLVASAEFAETDQDLAEGYDYLAGSIAAIVQLVRARSLSHPNFVTSTGPMTKMGLDNPDTLYYHADVEPTGTYVVRGRRGTTTDLSFQVLRGDYTPSTVPGGEDAFDDRRLQIAEDGSFELTFGPAIPDAGDDYFVLGEGASMLAVREVYSDWTERKGSITIERVDTVGTAPDEPDLARVARRYSTAGKMLLARINTWFNFPKWFYLDEPVNTFTPPRQTPGGLSTQFSSVGHYDLGPDDAMVISIPKSDAPYQGFQLGSMWYISLDYVNHQTSLNSAQAQVDPDGVIRMVVSHRDPGVANWIETTGRRKGILQFRWQRVDSPIGPELGPTAVVVPVDEVAAHLPYYEQNKIDEAGWRQRIAARQRAFAERMLG